MSEGWQVGIDIGGTFTDAVAFRLGQPGLRQAKVPSRPDDPIAGLRAALAALGIAWEAVDDLVHGTTLVTNAIVEGRLARTALVATRGFGDTLAIGRQNRRELYRLDRPPKLEAPIPDSMRFEVPERIGADGEVLEALSVEAIDALLEVLAASGAEAVAVALLHAYANGEHEARIGERLRERIPYVALSHRVSPEAREFERTSTTALSAGLMPLAAGYLDRLEAQRPVQSRLHLFHSAGGMASPAALRDAPLALAFSGPAAGAAAAGAIARELGLAEVLSFDMGGTTTDVCMIADGRAEIRADRSLAGRPLRMPMVAVESIGAGGGSIAWLDAGTLRVGPASAGARPGPACYGFGGEAATVSDANLVLGYLDDARPLGGVTLDRHAAEAALAPLAAATASTIPETARGIVRVANASMARALRRVSVERGVDGRRCTLLAFGGAGPMHAVELARGFGISRVVVPRLSSVFSALGCVSAQMSYTRQRTVRMASAAWDAPRLDAIRGDLRAQLGAPLSAVGCDAPEVGEVAAIRYRGQSYAVEVPAPCLDDTEALGAQFRARHQALYGFATAEPWELLALRMTLAAPSAERLNWGAPEVAAESQPPVARCWFDAREPLATPRHARAALAPDTRLTGPAIIEDPYSTVVLPPGASLTVDDAGHLRIEVGDAP